jgi:hypothetical protein
MLKQKQISQKTYILEKKKSMNKISSHNGNKRKESNFYIKHVDENK